MRIPCPACGAATGEALQPWHYHCAACGFEFSTLEARPEEPGERSSLDERQRIKALRQLRVENAALVLRLLQTVRGKSGARLLDVGCAYGWFLEVARNQGYAVVGVEPEAAIAGVGLAQGLDVRVGRFPQALGADETFDVICFNDVLEHIPDPAAVLRDSACHLSGDGLLSVVLPIRTGIFYRMAKVLERVGVHGPFLRMWQYHFHSPHLSYFSNDNLVRMARSAGLELVAMQSLPAVQLGGLWSRLRCDRTTGALTAALTWTAVLVASPVLYLLPKDIGHFVFRRAGPPVGAPRA